MLPRTGGCALGLNCLAAAKAPCASSSGFRDCLQMIITFCHISLGLKRSMSRACFVRRASFLTLGNMFHTIALTRSNWWSPIKRKMSLKVVSSKNEKWRLIGKFIVKHVLKLVCISENV